MPRIATEVNAVLVSSAPVPLYLATMAYRTRVTTGEKMPRALATTVVSLSPGSKVTDRLAARVVQHHYPTKSLRCCNLLRSSLLYALHHAICRTSHLDTLHGRKSGIGDRQTLLSGRIPCPLSGLQVGCHVPTHTGTRCTLAKWSANRVISEKRKLQGLPKMLTSSKRLTRPSCIVSKVMPITTSAASAHVSWKVSAID